MHDKSFCFLLCRENDPPLPPGGLETSGSPPELASSSVDIMPNITVQEKPTSESTSVADTCALNLTTAVEENTYDSGMDIENKSEPNLETHNEDDNERLEFESNDSSKETDQMMAGVTEMETGGGDNNEGAPCSDLGDQKESIKTDAETSDHLDVPTCDSDKKSVPACEMRKSRQQPTLLTMFAANTAAQQLKQQKSLEEVSTTKNAPPTSTPLPTPAPSLTGLDEFLLENDNKLTVDVPVIPPKPLTPMERFQQRLMKHMSASSSQPARREKKLSEAGGEEEGEESLVPEDVITKLKDKPGENLYWLMSFLVNTGRVQVFALNVGTKGFKACTYTYKKSTVHVEICTLFIQGLFASTGGPPSNKSCPRAEQKRGRCSRRRGDGTMRKRVE